MYDPTKYIPSTKKVAVCEEILDRFLEEGVLAEKYVKKQISPKRYNEDAYLGLINLKENTRGFFKLRKLKQKPRHEVYFEHKIQRQIVDTKHLYSHGFVEYHVVREDNQQYQFIEADYINLHPRDNEDIYKRRINCYNKKGVDQDIIESLKIFTRSRVVVVHVEDFPMRIKSYQKRNNLTPPMLVCPGIQKAKKRTCFEKPNL